MRNVILISFFICVSFLLSCSFHKSTTTLDNKIKYTSLQSIIENYDNNNYIIEYTADLKAANSKKIAGNIIITDQLVYANGVVKNLGIEVFKLLVWNDSIKYIDRINKEFYSGLIADFKMLTNYQYIVNNLNSILLGRIFTDINGKIDNKPGSLTFDYNDNNRMVMNYNYDGLLNNLEYCSSTCTNIGFDSFTKKKFPSSFNVIGSNNFHVIINYQSIKKYKKDMIKFNIPKSYSKL